MPTIPVGNARPMRVTIPATVAYDLKKFTAVIGNVAERLGCPNCISGAVCVFDLEKDWTVNPASLKLESIASKG